METDPANVAAHLVLVVAVDDPECLARIVVTCECGWGVRPDSRVTPADLWRLEQEHLSRVATADRPAPAVHHPPPGGVVDDNPRGG